MYKIKLAVGAFLLTSLQSVNSMEKNVAQFSSIARPVKEMIFEYAACDTKPGDLRLVCKDWQKTMDGKEINSTEQVTKYADIGPVWKKCIHAWYGFTRDEDVLKQFLDGKLIYKPNEDDNDGMIELKISDLLNPFSGKFDLSKCGDAGLYITVRTGFRKHMLAESQDKAEIWFAPHALIKKFSYSIGKHFEESLTAWDGEKEPFGFFYTWGNWDDLRWYQYLTYKSPSQISTVRLSYHLSLEQPFTRCRKLLQNLFRGFKKFSFHV